MEIETYLLAGGVAVVLGVLAARMMRVIGLAVLLVFIVAVGVGRVWLGLPHPSLVGTLILLVLIQTGFVLGVLTLSPADEDAPDESILPDPADDKGTAR